MLMIPGHPRCTAQVLSLKEKLRFVAAAAACKLGLPNAHPYTPSFSGSVDHFLIHAGTTLLVWGTAVWGIEGDDLCQGERGVRAPLRGEPGDNSLHG